MAKKLVALINTKDLVGKSDEEIEYHLNNVLLASGLKKPKIDDSPLDPENDPDDRRVELLGKAMRDEDITS